MLEPATWTGALYWTGSELLRNSEPGWAVAFPPVPVRHVRLRPARAGAAPWIVAEVDGFE